MMMDKDTQDNDGPRKASKGKRLVGEYRNFPYLQAIMFLHQLALLKDIWKAQFLGFIKLKKMI